MTRQRALALVGAVIVGALFVERAAFYYPFLSDDALISLRYAQRFIEGNGLTWTDGERVEGYTDFAWVLLTSLLGFFRVDLVVAARTLGALGAAAALIFTSLKPAREPTWSVVRIASGALFLALSDPFAAWANGALEHAFEAGVIVAAAWLLMRGEPSRPLTALLVLLALLRADGAVIISGLLLGNLLRGVFAGEGVGRSLRANVLLGLPPLGALVAQHLFRRAYYGQWVPNTALVKVSFSMARVELGLGHLREWAQFAWPVLAAVTLAVLAARTQKNKVWLIPLVGSLTWLAYLSAVGGDIFPAWRQVLLGLAPLGLVIAEGAEAWWAPELPWRFARFALCAIGLGLAWEYAFLQRRDPWNARAKQERWEQEGQSLGPALRAAWGDRKPLMAVDAAGTLPYHSRLPSLDMLGLCDRYIATHPPDLTGKLSTGHELGDGAYAFSRKPDILAFCAGMGGRDPCFLGGKQMLAQPGFREAYQLMRYHTPGPPDLRAELWIRREDGPLAIERSADRLRIPGWLMAERGGVTELDRGAFRARVSVNDPAQIDAVRVPAGRWRVKVLPESTAWTVGLTCNGQSSPRTRGGPLVIDVGENAAIGLRVGTASPEVASIDDVVLERTADEASASCSNPLREVDASFLTTRVPNGSHFHQPEGVLLWRGVTVRLRLPAGHAGAFEIALDGNDTYVVRSFAGARLLGETKLPTQPLAGLGVQRLDVPPDSEFIELTPETGDQLSGLGFLVPVR